jgi:hypothetical protein
MRIDRDIAGHGKACCRVQLHPYERSRAVGDVHGLHHVSLIVNDQWRQGLTNLHRSYSYMIDNVILLTLGTLHERDTHELLERCHPLGVFDTMPALCVATNVEELYHSVIVETPLGWSSLSLSLCCTDVLPVRQLRTSRTVCRRRIWTTSISKSFETPCTNPIWKTSTTSARRYLPQRTSSCLVSSPLKLIDVRSTSPSTPLAPN